MDRPLEPRRLESRPLAGLHLDPENPRLPLEIRDAPEDEIAIFIERQYDPLNLARSVATHGYFPSEPMIVVPQDGRDIVVEGNRRLVALRGLVDQDLRRRFARGREWDRLARMAEEANHIPLEVPVVVAASRLDVAPVIGYRHITGILGWDPYSQARYVAQLVDDHRLDFAGVSELLGEQLTVIRSRYRNFRIVEQARREFALDVGNAESDFGVLTRALQAQGVRQFIGAPEPAATQPGRDPIPTDRGRQLRQVFVWLFGDGDGLGRVIGESRDVVDLGRVLASATGLEVLEETGDLAAAVEAVGGIRDRLVSRLNSALRALRAAAVDIGAYRDDNSVRDLLDDIERAFEHLRGDDGR